MQSNLRAITAILNDENLLESFPPALGDVICRMAKRIGVSPWMLATPATSIFSYFLGLGSRVEVLQYDWSTNTLSWTLVIAHNGTGKSQAYVKLQKSVEAVEAQLNAEVKEKLMQYLEKSEIPEDTEEWEDAWRNAGFIKIAVDGAVSMKPGSRVQRTNFVASTLALVLEHLCFDLVLSSVLQCTKACRVRVT
jgi:hypothetical protein